MNATSERKRRCGKWKIILVSLCNPFFSFSKEMIGYLDDDDGDDDVTIYIYIFPQSAT